MQCNASNIETVAKQVWFYFVWRTMQLGYAGTMVNLQIVLNTPKNHYINQALKKDTIKLPLSKQPKCQAYTVDGR